MTQLKGQETRIGSKARQGKTLRVSHSRNTNGNPGRISERMIHDKISNEFRRKIHSVPNSFIKSLKNTPDCHGDHTLVLSDGPPKDGIP